MCFTRGSSADYDSWAKAGCAGWSWTELLPFFLKTENCKCPKLVGSEFHNTGGPLTITHRGTQLSDAFVDAGVELGFKRVDVNSGNIIGFGDFPMTIDEDGLRSSVARAYIHPAMERSNLTVLCNATVTKINIEDKKVVGVSFRTKKGDKFVKVNKEAIVSGGSINSPQILMLSGIGPKKHLQQFGIDCIADLPVGKNLQDHMSVQVKVSVKEGSEVNTGENFPSGTNGVEGTAFFKTGLEEPDNDAPDMQIHFTGEFYPFGPDAPDILVYKDPKYFPLMSFDTTREERMRKEGIVLYSTFLHPKSIGSVKLRSKDPFDPPIVDPNYLENPYDVKALIQGIRLAKKITETKAMAPFECKINCLKMPDSTHDEWSDENLEEVVRHYAWTLYHPSGTCKMGAAEDKTAVVDPQLRVLGIQGLRVVDASIMPKVTSGNTNAPCIMIGEKAADMIKNDRQ
ncbi:glucose dehydrogenase [FAD, quinone]-like [Amphiura filiformis]|uniref:glucose dehydrogenase [FAD, quinone]-like n=1 Tax=Amphiura filiformis TaxID=82378 RepID=UPI003B218050